MRLFLTELRKILISNYALPIMLAAIILQALTALIPRTYDYPYSIDVYKRYTEQLEGEFTAEKENFLRELHEEYGIIIAEYPAHREEYLDGKITLEEFSEYTAQNSIANAELSTIQYLLEKCQYLDDTEGFQKELFYDADTVRFFEKLGFDLIMLLALLCIAIPVFDREYTSGTIALILTSRYGKARLAVLKMLAAAIVIFVLSWFMSAVRLEVHIFKFGNDHFDRAVGNLIGYDGFGNVSILQYYLIDSLIKAVCWAVCAVKVCLITVICKNTTFSFIISFLAIASPLLLNGVGRDTAGMYIFDTVNLMRLYPSTLHFGIFATTSGVKLAVYGWFTVRLRKYRKSI